jgi:Flp pilus assembly protein TadG
VIVIRKLHLSLRPAALWRALGNDRATQIVEFALSLPLLVIFVVGIFDFSGALTLKQKLTNAAREGARVAASDPASDLAMPPSSGAPASVTDAFLVVDSYLQSEKVNDCGLQVQPPVPAPAVGPLAWASNAPCGGSTPLVLTINRGCITSQTTTAINVINTCVTIQYPYRWKFAGVAGLFGGIFSPSGSITTIATAFNEN